MGELTLSLPSSEGSTQVLSEKVSILTSDHLKMMVSQKSYSAQLNSTHKYRKLAVKKGNTLTLGSTLILCPIHMSSIVQ